MFGTNLSLLASVLSQKNEILCVPNREAATLRCTNGCKGKSCCAAIGQSMDEMRFPMIAVRGTGGSEVGSREQGWRARGHKAI